MSDATTASTSGGVITVGEILAVMEKVSALPKPDKWIVINPQGQAFEGTLEQVFHALARAHPLSKTLLTTPFNFEEKQQ